MPPFADVAAHSAQLAGAVIHLDCDWGFDRDASIPAPLALHQSTYGAKTGFSAFRSQGLIQDEMGAQVPHISEEDLGTDDGHGHCPLIHGSGTGAAEHARGSTLIGAVHDDGLKPPAGQSVNGGFGVGAKLQADFQLTQYPAQYAYDLLVGTKNQRL